ncbi:MAG: DNA-binding protein [Burkholderiales bacterium]|nr:DNA-binding protein [Burkholderiales bacterium]
MARTGLTRMEVKRARDALVAQGQHASIDAIRIALGNTGSKTTIHRCLKELEEEEGTSLTRAASLSDAIQDLVARLAARLHEEAQAVIDEQAAAATAQRQQAQAGIAKLTGELTALRAQLANAAAAVTSEQDAHTGTRLVLQERVVEVERLTQQVHDQTERLVEHEGFRQSLEEKLTHAHDALEHFRIASREQREQEMRRHEQQVQQLQAELRQANQTVIVKQNEITQLNKDNARLMTEAGTAAKRLREALAHGEKLQEALNRTNADQARAEAARDTLRATLSSQAKELERARESLGSMNEERAKLVAQVDAHQLLLADYRTRLGLGGAVG